MQWIDTHVHIFTDKETRTQDAPLYGSPPRLLDADHYLKTIPTRPESIVVVDFSRAPNPAHTINAIRELSTQQIPTRGIIRGLPTEETYDALQQDDISGLRLYALEACPDLTKYATAWRKIFNRLRHNKQHIVIYGLSPYLLELVKQLPSDIPLAIDHLGMPDASNGNNDSDFNALLSYLASRNKSDGAVYMKGPGYRSDMDAKKVAPFVQKIADMLGEERLMLGTSDAPFAKFEGIMTMERVMDYVDQLITASSVNAQRVMYDNAKELYGF